MKYENGGLEPQAENPVGADFSRFIKSRLSALA